MPDRHCFHGSPSRKTFASVCACARSPGGSGTRSSKNIWKWSASTAIGRNFLRSCPAACGSDCISQNIVVTKAGRERVMFFQDAGSALFPWLTVEENVRFGLRVRKVPRRERDAIVEKYLEMVGLDRHREKFPSQLSGGMRQRLQI